jgi:hemerythrin-like domain-containing protein
VGGHIDRRDSMSHAIDDLKNEHQAILLTLSIMERIISQIQMGKNLPERDITGILDFLRAFADKCHHGKEEGILFPELQKTGVPELLGSVRVMLSEHEKGRALITKMNECFPDHQSFAQTAIEYIVLLKNHIHKEDNILFPMAEKLIPQPEMNRIFRRFETHEEEVIGEGKHEQLHEMLKAWKNAYLE